AASSIRPVDAAASSDPAAAPSRGAAQAIAPVASATEPSPSTLRPGLRPYPSVVRCGGLGPVWCVQLVAAAVRDLSPTLPPVALAEASMRFLCDDPTECPPDRFVGYRPLGSVKISFGALGPAAWIDVVEAAPFPGRVWDPTDVETWMVRWRASG
ncbi:MAG TPA: hypothetical protein VEY67_00550, partial [Candidatus Dormibacteraeota bacterium]|nr:hypothetical protein [Candidatus Dormibacteraeota bacterium]